MPSWQQRKVSNYESGGCCVQVDVILKVHYDFHIDNKMTKGQLFSTQKIVSKFCKEVTN